MLIVILLIVGFSVNLPYYSLAPGTAMPVSSLISLPHGKSHSIDGAVLLTDVEIAQLRLIDVIPDNLDPNISVVSAQDLLGNTPSSQYQQQSVVEMSNSQTYAEVAALRRLGYQVPQVNEGAQVFQVQPGSPASGKLGVGDVISALDKQATPTALDVIDAVHSKQPGELVQMSVESPGGRARQIELRLSRKVVDGRAVPFVGVALETKSDFRLPVKVSVSSDGIGGPSAGLAFTLGIVDGMTTGDITGGKKVAATGTMDPYGDVGDVGGVAQKTVAVRDAGAKVFLVPPQEKQVAEAHAGPGLKIVAVSTLDQALNVLRLMGGNLSGVPLVAPPSAQGAA